MKKLVVSYFPFQEGKIGVELQIDGATKGDNEILQMLRPLAAQVFGLPMPRSQGDNSLFLPPLPDNLIYSFDTMEVAQEFVAKAWEEVRRSPFVDDKPNSKEPDGKPIPKEVADEEGNEEDTF